MVIACGGGGIPVSKMPKAIGSALEAVIDKDFASSLLARDIGLNCCWYRRRSRRSPSTSIGPISNGWMHDGG